MLGSHKAIGPKDPSSPAYKKFWVERSLSPERTRLERRDAARHDLPQVKILSRYPLDSLATPLEILTCGHRGASFFFYRFAFTKLPDTSHFFSAGDSKAKGGEAELVGGGGRRWRSRKAGRGWRLPPDHSESVDSSPVGGASAGTSLFRPSPHRAHSPLNAPSERSQKMLR